MYYFQKALLNIEFNANACANLDSILGFGSVYIYSKGVSNSFDRFIIPKMKKKVW
jgi:hypothetical protein